jgi:hypothetical protein
MIPLRQRALHNSSRGIQPVGPARRSPQPSTRAADENEVEKAKRARVGLITPSHRGDLDRFVMMIESMDKHVRRRGRHYVIVHDEDVALFEPYGSEDRLILPASNFLPRSLAQIPFVRWRGRRYWWRLGSKPISGWHAQQIVKIQAASVLPEERYCLVDSDNVFFRNFDLGEIAAPNSIPMRVHPLAVAENHPRHVKWIGSAHRLLGIEAPILPTDDYIDQIIVWDQSTIRAMIERIFQTTRRHWVAALCKEHDFSEYMIYGSFVAHNPAALRSHSRTTNSFCRAHWDNDRLDQAAIMKMLVAAPPHEVALCVQSFGETPLSAIKASLRAFQEHRSGAARLLTVAE